MNKLREKPTFKPPPHTHAFVEKTPEIHTHIVEGLDSTSKRNAPTQVLMYTHMCVHIHVYAYIYTYIHTYICICTYTHIHAHIYHAYMRTYIHIHVHEYLYTDRKSQQRHLNASNNIIDAHTHPHT